MSDYNNMIRCLWKGVADTDQQIDAADRIEELEAKLEKAVEALGTALSEMVDYADTHPAWSEIWEAREAARTTLAELTGGKDALLHGD